MDMRFGTWEVRRLYRTGSLKTVTSIRLSGCTGGQRGEGEGTERAEDYTFSYGEGNVGTGFFVHKRTVAAVKRVEFVSDRMSYIILTGRWYNIIVLNVHASCEDRGDDVKGSFYEELRHVFDQFPRYDMKILLVDFNAKVGNEVIFKPTIGGELTRN
jgi:hypothetical protein